VLVLIPLILLVLLKQEVHSFLMLEVNPLPNPLNSMWTG